MNRHFVRSMISLLFIIGILCGGATAQKVTIHYWTGWGGDELADIERYVISRFEELNPDIDVVTTTIFGSYEKLLTAIAAGEPPDVVSAIWTYQVPSLAQQGVLMPLDRFVATSEIVRQDDFFPGLWQQFHYNGSIYSLAATTNTSFIVYNKTLFEEVGLSPDNPPKTIEELEIAADKLTIRDESGRIRRLGYDAPGAGLYIWGQVFGGNFFDATAEKFTLLDPKVVEALEWMISYADHYGGMQAIQTFNSGLGNFWSPQNPLFTGEVAMAGFGEYIEQFNQRYGPIDYGVMPYPAPPGGRENFTTVGGSMFAIPVGTKHPEEAWRFIEWITGPEGSELMARILTNVSPRRSVTEKLVPEIPVFEYSLPILNGPNVVSQGPLTHVDQFFLDKLAEATEAALRKQTDPRSALRQAQDAIQFEYDMTKF